LPTRIRRASCEGDWSGCKHAARTNRGPYRTVPRDCSGRLDTPSQSSRRSLPAKMCEAIVSIASGRRAHDRTRPYLPLAAANWCATADMLARIHAQPVRSAALALKDWGVALELTPLQARTQNSPPPSPRQCATDRVPSAQGPAHRVLKWTESSLEAVKISSVSSADW
jgi:hypothetical protein